MIVEEIKDTDVVVVVLADYTGQRCDVTGQYFQDVDYAAQGGRGIALFSPNWEQAKRFASDREAKEFLTTISPVTPEVDGHPYRPLLTWMYAGVRLAGLLQMAKLISTVN